MAVLKYGFKTGNAFDDYDDDLGLTSTTTSGSSSQTLAAAKIRAATDAAKLKFDQDKLAAEQASNAEALVRAAAGRQAQGDYLRGQFQTGDPSAFGDIEAQNVASQNYINTQATNLLARLAGAKTTATDLTTTGYDNLKNYLGANVPQAYATAQNAVAPITTNALAQYMASRGVDQQPVQSAVDTANAGLASSAGNFNQLLNVLRGAETSGQQSRLSEEQMARALAGSNLEATYGAGRAGVESEQLSALNQLATQISNARLQAKAVQDARNQALQDALATLIGQGYTQPTTTSGSVTGNGCPPGQTKDANGNCVVPITDPTFVDTGFVPAPKAAPTPVEQLAAKVANITNVALATKIENYVDKNPNATKAQIAKVFPSLAKSITVAPRGGSSTTQMAFE